MCVLFCYIRHPGTSPWSSGSILNVLPPPIALVFTLFDCVPGRSPSCSVILTKYSRWQTRPIGGRQFRSNQRKEKKTAGKSNHGDLNCSSHSELLSFGADEWTVSFDPTARPGHRLVPHRQSRWTLAVRPKYIVRGCYQAEWSSIDPQLSITLIRRRAGQQREILRCAAQSVRCPTLCYIAVVLDDTQEEQQQ